MSAGLGHLLLVAALLVLVVALAGLLAAQWRQRRSLLVWLGDPERRPIPEGAVGWEPVFSALQKMLKDVRRERAALAARTELFRLAVQALPDGVVILDGEGHIEWMNTAACGHFGLDAARDAGTLLEHLIRHSEFHAHFAAFKAGTANDPLILGVGAEGARRVLSLLLIAFGDDSTLLLSRDITDLARTETMRRDFIANVSHELRTPLTVISGFLEQLTGEAQPDAEATRGFLRLMHEQAQRMNRLVADLLTLSRLENSTQPPADEAVDVPAIVHALVDEARALSGGRHTIELGEVAPLRVRGAADELRSAFGNLVSNAVRYTPASGRIVIAWRRESGRPSFSVTDSGIGIAAEHIPRLTERFYRVDKGRSTTSGGTGLGLAIVKHVMGRHQGALEIRSEIGRGSTFCARLPEARGLADET